MAYQISSKGQVTLPIEIRKRLGLKPGDKIDYRIKDGLVTVVPVRDEEENIFEKWIGRYPAFNSREEINDWISDLRDDEERKKDLQEIAEAQKASAA